MSNQTINPPMRLRVRDNTLPARLTVAMLAAVLPTLPQDAIVYVHSRDDSEAIIGSVEVQSAGQMVVLYGESL